MNVLYDSAIIGGGPAGVSAALTLRARGKSVLIVSSGIEGNPLYKAPEISNYPGLPNISGREMLEAFEKQAAASGAETVYGRALNIMDMGGRFAVGVGADFYSAKTVIIASGIDQASSFEGERELLGRGVSYCATCDGMLYRNKKTAVIGWSVQAEEEADFLRSIGCQVSYFEGRGKKYKILGADRVEGLLTGSGERVEADAVFILRNKVSVGQLMPEIGISDGAITVDGNMQTSVAGVFACGDCTGKPYQLAKAAGEGNIAALSAAEYIDKNNAK